MAEVRELVKKDYEEGMPLKDIATNHNISINTIKSWKRREGWSKGAKHNAPKTKACNMDAPKIKKGAEKKVQIVLTAKPQGNQSRWEEVAEKLPLIEAWCRDGIVESQIAKNLGIGVSTLSKYKVQHVELRDTFKRGKEVVDIEVENALFKRALGYEYQEVTQEPLYNNLGEPILDGEGLPIVAVTKVVSKHSAADVPAIKFWLVNRKALEWREKKEVDVNATIGKKLEDYLE